LNTLRLGSINRHGFAMICGRVFLISVALGSAILGVVGPFSWHYFGVQAYKEELAAREAAEQRERDAKSREKAETARRSWKIRASEVRKVESQARAGEKFDFIKDTSPLAVLKWKDLSLGLDNMDDNDVLELYRTWLYPEIPKDKFYIWGRDPFGQEKIDAAQKAIAIDKPWLQKVIPGS
jgi:hypothetical protein